MSGASSEACQGHRIIWGMSTRHCLGQSKISAVLHASLIPFFICMIYL